MLSDFSFFLFAVLGISTQEADIAAMVLRRMANTLDSHHSSENNNMRKLEQNYEDEHSCSFLNQGTAYHNRSVDAMMQSSLPKPMHISGPMNSNVHVDKNEMLQTNQSLAESSEEKMFAGGESVFPHKEKTTAEGKCVVALDEKTDDKVIFLSLVSLDFSHKNCMVNYAFCCLLTN